MNVNQISVFLENRTGQLAEITHLLADNGIDLRAISVAETADYGILRLIADDAERAASILLANGNILTMTPVMVVGVSDEPSSLSRLLSIIAEGEIGIEYMYSLFTNRNGKAYMVFRVSEEERLCALLERSGIMPVDKAELGLK